MSNGMLEAGKKQKDVAKNLLLSCSSPQIPNMILFGPRVLVKFNMYQFKSSAQNLWWRGPCSFSGLTVVTDLHIVPQGVNIDQEYYCTNILEANLFERKKKTKVMGFKSDVKLAPDMSELIFPQTELFLTLPRGLRGYSSGPKVCGR